MEFLSEIKRVSSFPEEDGMVMGEGLIGNHNGE